MSGDPKAESEGANEEAKGSEGEGDEPKAKRQRTLMAGTGQAPSAPEREAKGSASTRGVSAPSRRAKGKTLAGGTPTTRGKFWNPPKTQEGVDEEILDEVTAEELVEENAPPGPPPKKSAAPPPPTPSRRPPPRAQSVPPPPRKSRPKPPLKERGPSPSKAPASKAPTSKAPPPPLKSTPPRPPLKSAPAKDEPAEEAPVAEAPKPPTSNDEPEPPRAPSQPTPPRRPRAETPPPSAVKAPSPEPSPVTPSPVTPSPVTPSPVTPGPAPVATTPRPAAAAPAPPSPSLDLAPLAEVCEAELATSAKDAVRAARLHFELGRAAIDPTEALRHFRAALDQAPDFLPAIRAARRLQLAKKNVKMAAPLFDAEIKLASSAQAKATLLWEKGCAWLDLEGDRDAAQACFLEAAEIASDDLTILKALAHVEQNAKEWAKLIGTLEMEANAAKDDARLRAAVLTARARLMERRLQKSDEAIAQLQQALELDPTTPLAAPELRRLLHGSERWRELVTALEREASLTTSESVKAQAWWNIARVQDERLSSRGEAIAALENAARHSDGDAGLLEELARLYEASGDLPGAASALERLGRAVARPKEQVAVYQRLAELHDRPDGDPEAAVRWYEAALQIDPGFSPALRSLDRLYAMVGNWQALAAIYAAEGGAKGPSVKRAAAFARAAAICDGELGRPDLAITHYARALALDPGHEGAFKALVRLYTAAGSHHELIELYDRAVDRATSEDVAVAYLFKMGSLYEDVLRDPKSAVEIYERILERDDESLGAIHALQRAAEQAGEARALVDALDAEVALIKDNAREVRLQHRAAEVVADELGDLDAALPRLTAILKRAPRDVPTLETLARLYRHLGRHADLLAVNERQLAVVEDPSDKVALLVAMGDLAERDLGRPEEAIKWFRRALDLDPEHGLAAAAVGRLLRTTGDYKELAKVLATELEGRSDEQDAARTALLLGEALEIHLDKPKEAIDAYWRALDAVPGYPPAVDALIRVYGARGDYKELASVLVLAADNVDDHRLRLEARLLAETIRAERLHKTVEAADAIEAISEEDPENLAALRTLERLYVDDDDTDRLGHVLTRQAEVLGQDQARVAALVTRGRLIEKGGLEGAQDSELRSLCTTVLANDPSNDWALGALRRVAERSQDAALEAEVESRYTRALQDAGLLSDHYTRLGAALADTNPAAALEAYRTALEHNPDQLTAIRGLSAMAAKNGDAETMVDAYRREAAWRRDPSASADLYVQSAAVLDRLGQTEAAIADSERALATHPEHALAAEQLTAFLLRAGKVDRLVEQLSQAAHATKELDRKVALWREVGELQAQRRGDLGAAISAVGRALEAKPNDMGAILQLASLHGRDQQHDEAAALLARAVAIDDANLDAHLQLAGLYAEHLDEPNKAHRHVDRVLKDRPDDIEALRLRLTLQLGAKQRDAAKATSEQLLEAAGDDDATRAWALVEIGRSEMAAGDTAAAANALHDAVSLVGLDGEAASAYGKLLGDKEPWDRYADALATHLKRSKQKTGVDKAKLASVHLELARVQHRLMDRAVDAFRTIEMGIARCGALPELELRQAELLVATQQHNDALLAFQALTAKHPQHHETWRGLVRVFQQLGRGAEASITASAIVALGEATEAERSLAIDRPLRPGAARPGSFGAASIRLISAGGNENEEGVAGLFNALADPLGKVYPIPFEIYGVRKGDRIKARTPHAVRQEVDALCQIFSIDEVDLYVHAGMGGDVIVELGDPPSLMVPQSVADMPEAQRIFLLARPLAAIAAGLHPVLKLGPEETALVLAAAVRRLVPSFEDGMHDPERLAALQERLSPSWFGRGKVDEATQRYYAQPVDAKTWAPTVIRTATRAGAILCGDLDAVVSALRATGEVGGASNGEALVAASPLIADVMQNWMSERALELRRLGGIVS